MGMTNDELQAIRARAEAATPGQWNSARLGNAWGIDVHTSDGTYQGNLIKASIGQNNAQFISHARTDIPALLEHIEAQRAALEQAWYVLDSAAAGVAPKVAAIMARAHVEKFIGARESNFDGTTKEAASE